MLQASTGFYSSLEAGPGGTLHLAFYDYVNGDLRYASRSSAGEWAFETVDTAGNVGWFASLELDDAGVPHIAYHEHYNDKLKYAVRQGPNNWTIEVVDSAPGRGWYSSLDLDASGNPHIAYADNRDWDLRHAWKDPATGWCFEVVDSAGEVGFYCGLALNSATLCRISYYDRSNGRLKFAWQQPGGGWKIEVVDDSGDVGFDTVIALDDQEHPHVAYWDRGNYGIKYAWHDGTIWHTETVESGAHSGYEAAIVWKDGPRISYEGTLGARYAEKVGGCWRIYQVDRTGYKCGDTALALEGAGHPRMTYLNYGNMDLYYAEGTDSNLPGAPTPEPIAKIADARAKPDGAWISIGDQLVSASGPVSGYYIESPSRCAGICADFPQYCIMPAEGDELQVVGVVETKAGIERVIRVCDWTKTGEADPPDPLFATLKSLSVFLPTSPLTSLGLLARVAGRVVSTGQGYLVVDDSSPAEQRIRVALGAGWTAPQVGQFAAATGVLSQQMIDGNPTPVLLPRRSEDIIIIPE